VPIPFPEPGLVICYSYLWCSEYERGHEEGAKNRPCVVVLTAENKEGYTIVTVAAVTHAPPEVPHQAVEIPLPTKRRLGLDDAPSWIIVREVNRFRWPGPDLRHVSPQSDRFDYGLLPPSLFRQVKERLVACAKAQRLKAVPRTPG
jgi:hypothetical protein